MCGSAYDDSKAKARLKLSLREICMDNAQMGSNNLKNDAMS